MKYLENPSLFMRTNGRTGLAKQVGAFRSFEPWSLSLEEKASSVFGILGEPTYTGTALNVHDLTHAVGKEFHCTNNHDVRVVL